MFRKQIVKDLNGNILTLMDEADGGYIIRNRQIVNPAKWEALQQKEKDRIEAAKAPALEKKDANAPDRNVTLKEANKMVELEKKVEGMESKLDAILNALNAKKP